VIYSNFVPKTYRFEIFDFKNSVTLKSGSEVSQGHCKWYHSIDCYSFLLVFYSNFVPNTEIFLKYSTCNYTVILKLGLGVTQGHRTCRSAIYDFLLTLRSNDGLSRTVSEINCDFSRKSQNVPTPVYFAPPLKGLPLELGIGARC